MGSFYVTELVKDLLGFGKGLSIKLGRSVWEVFYVTELVKDLLGFGKGLSIKSGRYV